MQTRPMQALKNLIVGKDTAAVAKAKQPTAKQLRNMRRTKHRPAHKGEGLAAMMQRIPKQEAARAEAARQLAAKRAAQRTEAAKTVTGTSTDT